jgi:hypothetical protein
MSSKDHANEATALEKFETKRLELRKKYFRPPNAGNIELDCTFTIEEAHPVFEERGGKRVANSQRNIIAALRVMHVHFFNKGGDNLNPFIRYPGVDEFDLADDWPVNTLWLAIDRRFDFRPSFPFFQTVLGDHGRRMAGMDTPDKELWRRERQNDRERKS